MRADHRRLPLFSRVADQAQNALSSSWENVMTSDDCRFCCTNAGPTPQGASRRVFLLGAAAAAGGLLAAPHRAAAAEPGEAVPLFAYIGCFTSERRKAHAKGISVYRIDANGSWSLVQTLETLPNPQFITFDQRQKFLYSVHTDRTHIYRLDLASGKLLPNNPAFAGSRPGAGPRHLAFHPAKPWAYVCDELDSTVTAYAWDSARGELKPFQVITTLPEDYVGGNTTAEIQFAPSGHYLYVSNRGHNSIVIFSVDQASGKLSPIGWESTRGRTPRFFGLDPTGHLLYAANLDSDNIVVFMVDTATGKLTPTGQVVETGSPSCIIFARA